MTHLRHAGRSVHKTVADYLEAQLAILGWKNPDATPLGAKAITITRNPIVIGDQLDPAVTAGLVAISLGDEGASTMDELGGPLSVQEYPIFVDIFQDADATALALATDVRDIFMGRLPGTKRFLDVINAATGQPADGWQIEFEDVERIRPETPRLAVPPWHVVKVTATTYFPEVVY